MSQIDINNFNIEKECIYKNEHYSVRDNGAVLRHKRIGKRIRKEDDQWTFGKENSSNPYLNISGERIHRIVATAFHGDPLDSQYVVDHIDTNCKNNRPENLRWLSRLDNALKNPITRKRIEFYCGSIEAFLNNPSMLNDCNIDHNFKWMRTVTPEEAHNSKERLHLWLNTPNKTRNKNVTYNSLNERIYQPVQKWEVFGREPGLDLSLTPRCAEYMWRGPSSFPCCPEQTGSDPLDDYFKNLEQGKIFANNEFHKDYTINEFIKIKNSILVLCNRQSHKPWSITKITLYKGYFIHANLGPYLEKEEAYKALSIIKLAPDLYDYPGCANHKINYIANANEKYNGYEDTCKSIFKFTVGQTVKHPKFGIGNVLNFKESGEATVVQVKFEKQFGVKWLVAKIAKLEIMNI